MGTPNWGASEPLATAAIWPSGAGTPAIAAPWAPSRGAALTSVRDDGMLVSALNFVDGAWPLDAANARLVGTVNGAAASVSGFRMRLNLNPIGHPLGSLSYVECPDDDQQENETSQQEQPAEKVW